MIAKMLKKAMQYLSEKFEMVHANQTRDILIVCDVKIGCFDHDGNRKKSS